MAQIEKTVFISYRRKDISWALLVYDYLTSPKHKYDVFFDFTSIPAGDFEQIILSNIKARAHFVLLLTPTALDRCNEPGDWLRREIEFAIDQKRNIIPLFFDKFSFGSPNVADKLTGKLSALKRYNGLEVPSIYFKEAMNRLRKQYLSIALDAVLHPVSMAVQEIVRHEQAAVNQALIQKNEKTIALPVEHDVPEEPLKTMDNTVAESVISRPPDALVFYPTVELTLRTQPVISPDTVIRRIPVIEELLSLEPASVAIPKVGVQSQWLKVRDHFGTKGYVAAWCVTASTTETARGALRATEDRVQETFQAVLGSLAEEASSEIVQQELEAMSKAIPEDIESIPEPVLPLPLRLQRIVQEFASGEIGRDTSMEELNLILAHLPKTQAVKG
jgi:hypothetical protein